MSDASHELRSPVAAIRTDARGGPARRGSGRLGGRRCRPAGRGGAARALLDDLLTLASADEDAGTKAAARPDERIDVGDLVADVAARPRRVPVRWARAGDSTGNGAGATVPAADDSTGPGTGAATPATPDGLVVAGRPDTLARLLTNLVDNAARHASTAVERARRGRLLADG